MMNEEMMNEEFSVIKIKGKKVYLQADGNGFKWTTNVNDAIWFDYEQKAEQFAYGYFKNFKNYDIVPIEYNIKKDKITV